jgi:hypothetical protein
MLADAVMLVHLGIVVFNAAMLVLVPWGANRWRWVRHRALRQLHVAMMVFIAAQALLGQHCPLTLIESALRTGADKRLFVMRMVEAVLYWDLPPAFFAALYCACALWTIALWVWVRPRPRPLRPAPDALSPRPGHH